MTKFHLNHIKNKGSLLLEAHLNFFIVLLLLTSFYAVIWQCYHQEQELSEKVSYWRKVYEKQCAPEYEEEKIEEPDTF